MINHTCKPFSYLEFGSVDPHSGIRNVYDYRFQSQAYDWLMHARYSNDIVAYHQMMDLLLDGNFRDIGDVFKTQVHHPDDIVFNFNKLLAISLTGSRFFELGQTLFGCIDGMEFVNKLNAQIFDDFISESLLDVYWDGVDISPYFNSLAKIMHASYHVSTRTSPLHLRPNADVFFAKGITLLYVVRTPEQLYELIDNTQIAILDYSFSLCGEQNTQIGTGKDVCYLRREEFDVFYSTIKSSGKDIWVRNTSGPQPAQNKFYLEGIICRDSLAGEYIAGQTRWRNAFRLLFPELYHALVHNDDDAYWSWSRLDDIINDA